MQRRLFLRHLAIFSLSAACLHSAVAQDWAKAALAKSPRHREYVAVHSGARIINTFVVYPETAKQAPVVVMIHEIFGLSDWAKSMADQLAAQGYIVLAPDLLSGTGPNGGGTDSYPDTDAVTKAVSGLAPAQVIADLNAVSDYGLKQDSSNKKLAVVGFCWGGGKSFAFATERKDLKAAFVFYGPPPDAASIPSISAPVFGFYAGNDARIDASIPGTEAAMKAAGKGYEPVTYPGAGHGFMRAGQAPDASPENKQARDAALKRLLAELKTLQSS